MSEPNKNFEKWLDEQIDMTDDVSPWSAKSLCNDSFRKGQEALLAKGSRVQILPTMELLWFTEAKPHNATLIKDEDLK